MTKQTLFITGTSGFIGRELVLNLAGDSELDIRALQRSSGSPPADNIEIVHGDLLDPSTYQVALQGADMILHLAAATGKATPQDYERVNLEGTRSLIAAGQKAGVRRMLFVSTIAAAYEDQRYYPYAQTKQKAEELVRQSDMEYAIIRPTIVLGTDSPIWATLSNIGKLPIIPLPQSGKAIDIQPVEVGDVVTAIMSLIRTENLGSETYDIGGPQSETLSSFLGKIGQISKGKEPKIIPIPLAPIRWALAMIEPVARPVLPVTAGQLSLFANDSTITPNTLHDQLKGEMLTSTQSIEKLLEQSLPGPKGKGGGAKKNIRPETIPETDEKRLKAECSMFCNYLIGTIPAADIESHYVKANTQHNLANKAGFSTFDQTTLRLALRGPVFARSIDAFCALFRRRGVLRRKLIIISAILEHTALAGDRYDKATAKGAGGTILELIVNGLSFGICLIFAALVLLPIRLLNLSGSVKAEPGS